MKIEQKGKQNGKEIIFASDNKNSNSNKQKVRNRNIKRDN